MWIYTKHGFISIVNGDDDKLQVRAREPNVLKKLFGGKIVRTDNADYRYRCIVSRADVARVIANEIIDIDYSNFKGSVSDAKYHHVLTQVWYDTLALEECNHNFIKK